MGSTLNSATTFPKKVWETNVFGTLAVTQAFLPLLRKAEKARIVTVSSVQFLSEKLNLSPGYLSDMLRSLIGQNAQQYIHEKLIEKAKERLTTTQLSMSEIAYELGFEHSQSFSKLFKNKTNQSPMEFRASFT